MTDVPIWTVVPSSSTLTPECTFQPYWTSRLSPKQINTRLGPSRTAHCTTQPQSSDLSISSLGGFDQTTEVLIKSLPGCCPKPLTGEEVMC